MTAPAEAYTRGQPAAQPGILGSVGVCRKTVIPDGDSHCGDGDYGWSDAMVANLNTRSGTLDKLPDSLPKLAASATMSGRRFGDAALQGNRYRDAAKRDLTSFERRDFVRAAAFL
jgi:hypothetical protein